ncbi:hypothetical protein BKA69DRAFT_1037444 [Paraphysoderma sedebokerense]|nr:hypothetical protein BKA69DRAFT_1037444 [Paraphysoderma sedebokerense]
MAHLFISMCRLPRHRLLPFSFGYRSQKRNSNIIQNINSSVIHPSAAFTSNESSRDVASHIPLKQSSQFKTLDDDTAKIVGTLCISLAFIYLMITTNGQSFKNEVMPLLVSMNQRIEKMDVKMDENKKELEVRLNETKRKLEGKIDSKIDRLEAKMDENKTELEARLNETKRELEGKIEKLEGKMDDNFKSLNEKLGWLW